MANSDHLTEDVQSALRAWNVPGVALAIVKGDDVTYHDVFGVRPTPRRPPLTGETLFQAASLSKPVFAYFVLKLAELGTLDLDVPLTWYWRDPSVNDPHLPLITARRLLSHTAGFPNWRVGKPLATRWRPGERFGYSGEGYEYLQRVVEHLLGQPLHKLMRAQVLDPLGMQHSTYAWAIDDAGNFLLDDDGAILPASAGPTASSAAFSFLTTAQDYARFLCAMLNPPSDADRLNQASIRMMLERQIQVGRWSRLHWGLGWGIQDTRWGDAFWHWGGAQNGYMNYVVGFPSRRLGLVILTNSERGLDLCQQVMQMLLRNQVEQPAFDWLLPFDAWSDTPD
jgi:CubicO group peptidase (beta-lactamase class C family)